MDTFSVSDDLGCQPCDCHTLGSMSSKCNEATGQCVCRENVVGRTCDRCAQNFAGMDELGCKGDPFCLVTECFAVPNFPHSRSFLVFCCFCYQLSHLHTESATGLYTYIALFVTWHFNRVT